MDTTSAVATDPTTIVPASTSTNATTELTTTSNDINVNQSNSNSSAHIAGDTGNRDTGSSREILAAVATTNSGNNGSSNNNNSSCNSNSSSSSSSTSSGYGSTTTTPTNNNYETQQQQQTPTPRTPVAIAEPIIPVATVAAVTPFYNEAITTHNLEIQHQQQQQQHHQQQQQQQLQQNLQHHQYLQRQQYYSPYDYQQQTSNLPSSSLAYNVAGSYDITSTPSLANETTSSLYGSGQYKSSNVSAINYERNLAERPTAAATSYYHQQQVQNEQNSKSLQNLQSTTNQQQQQFAKQRSSTSLITSSTNINTSKPQAAATPFYAQPLPQHSNPATFYDNLKHKIPLEYHHHDSYTNPATATYHQQQKYYAAAKSQLKEATSYGSPGLASKSLYPNPTNFYPSSSGNHSLSSSAYDKYLYPHATGYPSASHLVNETPPDTSYRKAAVANTLNSPSWPWGIEYASGNSRTIPPPTTHLPTATVAPTHSTYLTPNPSTIARDPYYMAQDKYNMKYDKYSTAACPPSYQQSYVSPPATRHHMWPSSHGPQLTDRHHLATQPPTPIHQHALHSTPYYPANSASVLNARQSCCPQPYQPQNCYYPSPHPPNTRLAHNQPPPTAIAPTAAAYMSTQQPLNQTPHLNALSSSCKYGGVMADYGNVSGNKLKGANDLYLTSHYDANNYGAYGSNQLYQSNAHQLPNHGPSQGSILTHDPASYTNDLNITSNFDNYPPHLQDPHITPNTFGATHSQQSPQYAPTVVKRALLDYRKPIQPQPPPSGQEEEVCYTTLTPASREYYQQQELLNTPETTTAFADYETNQEINGLTYNQTTEEGTETDKANEEANKNLSLRDFIANWNDDEDEYNNADDLNFDEATVINEVLQATPQASETNDAELEPPASFETLKPVEESKESSKLTEKLNEALNVNLPDIVIDIEKSNNVNNSITTPSISPTTNIEEPGLILNNFDVEQELDQLKKKKEDEKLEISKDLTDIKEHSGSSVTTPQLSPTKVGVTTQLSFEDLNLTQPNKTVLITTRPDTNSTNEQYLKDIEGYDSSSSRHSNESAFEKEYETFINKITSDATSKTNIDNVKTSGEMEIDFEQNVQDFSKFYKRKRKLKEDEQKSSSSLTTQNKKKIKSASEEIVNNSNFPQVYTKKSRNRLLKHNAITRKHKPLSLYYKIIHSLRRYRLYRMKRVRDYITELKEKHLPLIKRQSIKNYSHAVEENIFNPKSLKSLTILAINTTEFRERIMLSVEDSTENTSELEEKHICTDPSCETCEVIRSLMEPESFENLKPSTESEDIYEISEECVSSGIIFQDLPEYSIQYSKAEIPLCQDSEILLCETDQQIVDSVNVAPILQVLIPETNEQLKTAKAIDVIHSSLEFSSEIVNNENILKTIPLDIREAEINLDIQNSNQNDEEISKTNVKNQVEDKKETDLEMIPEKIEIESKNLNSKNDNEEIKSFSTLSLPFDENLKSTVLNAKDCSNESPNGPFFQRNSPKSNNETSEELQPEEVKDTYPILKISELLKKSQKFEKKLETPMSPTFETTSPKSIKEDSNNLQLEKDSYPILKMSELLKKSQKFEKKFSESFKSDQNLLESNMNSERKQSDDEDSKFSDDSLSDISDNDELLNKSPNQKNKNELKLDETSKEPKMNDQIVAEAREAFRERTASKESIVSNTDSQAIISNENKNDIDDNKIDFETKTFLKNVETPLKAIEDDTEDSDSSDSDSESSSDSDSSMDDNKESAKMSTDKESSSDSDSESDSDDENITDTNIKFTSNKNEVKSIIETSLPSSIESDNDNDSESKNFAESVKESENLNKSGSQLSLPIDNKSEDENITDDKSPTTIIKNTVKENSKTLYIIADSKNNLPESPLETNKDSDSEWDDESEDENTDIIAKSPKSSENIVKLFREKDLNSPKSVKESENLKLQPISNKNRFQQEEQLKDAKFLGKDSTSAFQPSLEYNKSSDSDWDDESDEENTESIPEKPTSNEKGLKLILKLKDIKSYRSFRKEHLKICNENSRPSESDSEDITKTKIKVVEKGDSQTKLTSNLRNKSSKINATDIDSYSDFGTETDDDDIYKKCSNKSGHNSVQILRASQTLLQHNLELLQNAENSNISHSSHQMSLDFFKSAEDPEVCKSNSILISDDECMDISENLKTKDNASAKECLNHLKSTEEPKENVVEDAILISDDEIVNIPNQQKSEIPVHLNKNDEGIKEFPRINLKESKIVCEDIETVEDHEKLLTDSLAEDKTYQLFEVKKLKGMAELSVGKVEGTTEEAETENLRKMSSTDSLEKNEELFQELSDKYHSQSCTENSKGSSPPFRIEDLKFHNITPAKPHDSLSNESSKVSNEIQEFSPPNVEVEKICISTEFNNSIPVTREANQFNTFHEVLDLSSTTAVKNLEENIAMDLSEDTCSSEESLQDNCQNTNFIDNSKDNTKINFQNLPEDNFFKSIEISADQNMPHSPEGLVSNIESSENIETNSEIKSNEMISNSGKSFENEKLSMKSSKTANKIADKLEDEQIKLNTLTTEPDYTVDDFQESDEIIPNSPEKHCNSSENGESIMETSKFTNKTAEELVESKPDSYTSKSIIGEEPNAIIPDSPDSPDSSEEKMTEIAMVELEAFDEIAKQREELKPHSNVSKFDEIFEECQEVKKIIPDSPDSPEEVVTTVENLDAIQLHRNSTEEVVAIVKNFNSENFLNKEIESNEVDDHLSECSENLSTDIKTPKSYETNSVFPYRCSEKEDSVKLENFDDSTVKKISHKSPFTNECISETKESRKGHPSSPMNFDKTEVVDNIEMTEEYILKNFKTIENKNSEIIEEYQVPGPNSEEHKESNLNENSHNSILPHNANNESEVEATADDKLNEISDEKAIISLALARECAPNECKDKSVNLKETENTKGFFDYLKQDDSFSESSLETPKINDFKEKSDKFKNVALQNIAEESELNHTVPEAKTEESKVNNTPSEPLAKDIDRMEVISESIVDESEDHNITLESSKTREKQLNQTTAKTRSKNLEPMDDVPECVVDESISDLAEKTKESVGESKCIDTLSESTIKDSEPMEITSEPILNDSTLCENVSNSNAATEDRVSKIIIEISEQKNTNLESTIKDDKVISKPAKNKSIQHEKISLSTFEEPELSHTDTNSDILEEATTKSAEETECWDEESVVNKTSSKSELNNNTSDPTLEGLKSAEVISESAITVLNDITESTVDERKLHESVSELTQILKHQIPEAMNEESAIDELKHHEKIPESNEKADDRNSETMDEDESEPINKDTELNYAISETAVNKPKLLETNSESTETINNQSFETAEINFELNDILLKSRIKDSVLNVISETSVDELKLSKTISQATATIDKESTFDNTYSKSAINASKLNDTNSKPTVEDSRKTHIISEPTIQESVRKETVLESLTEDRISKGQTKKTELNELTAEDQISEDLPKYSELNKNISEPTVDETEELNSTTAIAVDKSELNVSTQTTIANLEPIITEPDVSETILESIIENPDLNASNPNNESNQTYSEETKSENLQHYSTQNQQELVTDKESTTEDLSGDFFGFKIQSSFEEESEDFHGFEDIEEATRIRREMENLNDDSAANDGFLNSTLNKNTQKPSTASVTESTTSEINELEALEKEISQQHIENKRQDEDEKQTDTALVNETNKIISTNDIEHIKKMLESDEEPQQDETEYHLKKDLTITSNDEKTPQTKDVIKTITDSKLTKYNDNDNFVENFRDISKDIINSVIPKLSDLCRAALNSSLNTNNLTIVQNVQDQIDKTDNDDTPTILVERELTVEEALAEMYRQAGVLLSDAEDNDNDTHRSPTNNCNEEAQDVLLINLQEILNSDNDVYVLQCDMNKNVLNLVQTNNENEDPSEENMERVNTVQFIGILDTENSEPQIHIISSDSESEVIILSDDCESDFEPITERHERIVIPFINDFDINTDDNGNLSDISTIHHEEIVPDNLDKFLQEEFYKYLHEKYVQRNISKYYHANRILKKYKKREVAPSGAAQRTAQRNFQQKVSGLNGRPPLEQVSRTFYMDSEKDLKPLKDRS